MTVYIRNRAPILAFGCPFQKHLDITLQHLGAEACPRAGWPYQCDICYNSLCVYYHHYYHYYYHYVHYYHNISIFAYLEIYDYEIVIISSVLLPIWKQQSWSCAAATAALSLSSSRLISWAALSCAIHTHAHAQASLYNWQMGTEWSS